ncbi:hypothetical protein AB0F42_34460 [Streptomyces buecherae]|uniref:hypothetical protein n=1 Tax=Streptomyces buecherae TaxID=2763006 RepID=UPI0033CB4037
MQSPEAADEKLAWPSLGKREKVFAALGMAGLGVGILAVLTIVVVMGILVVTFLSNDLIEAGGIDSILWALALILPYSLFAGMCTAPLRIALRSIITSERAMRRMHAITSAATTFLGALFLACFTPGVNVQHPWLPSLLTALFVALTNIAITQAEIRRKKNHQHQLL